MSLKETAQTIGTTAAVGLSVANPFATVAISNSSVPDGLKESAITLNDNFTEAFSEAASDSASRSSDIEATGDPVPEPEQAIHSDPPEGVDVDALAASWNDAVAPANAAGMDVDAGAIGDPGAGAF